MRRATRTALAVTMCFTLAGAGLALGSPGAGAAPTPIFNTPPGGGPIETVVIKHGPFNLDPQGTGHDQDESEGLVERPEGTYGIKSASFDLVDEMGNPIGRHDVHLHHYVIASINTVDTACPDRKAYLDVPAEPLIGSGMERTPLELPDPYALKVFWGQQWGARWHLMNMTNTPKTFYVQYTLGIQRGANDSNTRWVKPFWADSYSCPAGTTWDVPGNGGPDSVETLSKTWDMPFDGYIVGIGGHMHDGGIRMTTSHEDGSVICKNDASYAGGMLDKISRCPVHDAVKKGEKVKVQSEYDNSFPHDDVMGMSVMYLWEGDQGTPPSTTTTSLSTSTTSTTTVADPAAAGLTGGNGNVLGTSGVAPAVSANPAFAG